MGTDKKPVALKKGAGTEKATPGSMPTTPTPEKPAALSGLPESHLACLNTFRTGFAKGIEEWLQHNQLSVEMELKLKEAIDSAQKKAEDFLEFPPSPMAPFVTSALKKPLARGGR